MEKRQSYQPTQPLHLKLSHFWAYKMKQRNGSWGSWTHWSDVCLAPDHRKPNCVWTEAYWQILPHKHICFGYGRQAGRHAWRGFLFQSLGSWSRELLFTLKLMPRGILSFLFPSPYAAPACCSLGCYHLVKTHLPALLSKECHSPSSKMQSRWKISYLEVQCSLKRKNLPQPWVMAKMVIHFTLLRTVLCLKVCQWTIFYLKESSVWKAASGSSPV